MFISFEGIDFSGKTTQVKLLEHYFIDKGKKVKLIREPGGTLISEKVRSILLDKENHQMSIETEILLFSAARSQLVREVILPYIQDGTVVITDRFFDSTTAYQGYGRGVSLDAVQQINKFAVGECIPDITVFIDIPIEEMEKRKYGKNSRALDRMELASLDFFHKVREGFLSLSKTENRIKLINGILPVEEIHEIIIEEIKKIENRQQ
ncbi:MAG: dTMP kinase [Ignavibacteriaceae bacterium]|jgi:dTMP kinase|nr:dTMP kinase [Ignavibacteriaceae bacterium]